MRPFTFVVIALCCLAAPAVAQSSIKKVDFKNFSYRLRCGDVDVVSKVAVKGGEYRGDKRGVDIYLSINKVIYGDLNRDRKDEAIVLYSCGSGASYVYFRGLIFTMDRKRPVFLASLEGGNKGDGGFHEVIIRKGLLVVERYELGIAGSPCCPEKIRTTKYRLSGTKLLEIGSPSHRNIERADSLSNSH